jgi:D-glycero-alpha-D-manno-heptose 1-phosphate guanylyltransferase
MIAAILAGGLGTRLRSVIGSKPKPLAEVSGSPFLEYVLRQVKESGITKVVLCTGYLAHQIESAFGSQWQGLQLFYSEELQPLGTAGALRLALPLFSDETVLVLNGDSFYRGPLDPLIAAHRKVQARATLLLAFVQNSARFGTVEAAGSGEVQRFLEKDQTRAGPAWVSAGVYVIEREVIAMIPGGRATSLERETFPGLIGNHLFAWCGTGEFLDIGTRESYAQASQFFVRPSSGTGSQSPAPKTNTTEYL